VDGAVGFGSGIQLENVATQLAGATDGIEKKLFFGSHAAVGGDAQWDFGAGIPEADTKRFAFFVEDLHQIARLAIGRNIADHAAPDVRVVGKIFELNGFHKKESSLAENAEDGAVIRGVVPIAWIENAAFVEDEILFQRAAVENVVDAGIHIFLGPEMSPCEIARVLQRNGRHGARAIGWALHDADGRAHARVIEVAIDDESRFRFIPQHAIDLFAQQLCFMDAHLHLIAVFDFAFRLKVTAEKTPSPTVGALDGRIENTALHGVRSAVEAVVEILMFFCIDDGIARE